MTTAPQVRDVIERLMRDGTAVARADGSVHGLFPVVASATEGEAIRDWVVREGAFERSRSIWFTWGASYVPEGSFSSTITSYRNRSGGVVLRHESRVDDRGSFGWR